LIMNHNPKRFVSMEKVKRIWSFCDCGGKTKEIYSILNDSLKF
jgi:hypothetical protein